MWIRLVLLLVACMVVPSFAGVEAVPKFEVVTAFAKSPEHPGRGSLIELSPGVLYGTTTGGGDYGCGAIYKLVSGVYTPVLHFTGTTGAAKGSRPIGTLLVDGTVIWGVTEGGGAYSMGTVYKFNTATGSLTTVVEFGTRSLTDPSYMGVQPRAGLVRDGNGMLWGVTSSVSGRVFKIDPVGGTAVPVVQLNGAGGMGAGVGVRGELVFDGVDSLWGAVSDPSLDYGKVYKIHQNTGAYTVVVAFTGNTGAVPGKYPTGSLVLDASGWMVGLCARTTSGSNPGLVYKIEVSTGKYAVVGNLPVTAILYGVQEGLVKTSSGSYMGIGVPQPNSSYGSVLFSLSLSSVGTPNVRGFTSRYLEGEGPVALTPMADGTMTAAMSDGGRYGKGMVMGLSLDLSSRGTYSIGLPTDPELQSGSQPAGGLIQDPDGRLWGLAKYGGTNGEGGIYSFLPHDDVVKNGWSFWGNSSARFPAGELLVSDSSRGLITLQGFLSDLGSNSPSSLGYGAPFTATSSGGTVRNVTTYTGGTYKVKNPVAGFATAADGSLWAASGTEVYAMKYASPVVRTVTATFTGTMGAKPGSEPAGRLFLDGQGFMWGATKAGGAYDFGTLYKISTTPPYEFTSVVQFTGKSGPSPGNGPTGALIADASGMLWGTTMYGGIPDKGTVFKLDPVHGVLTTVVVFDNDSHSVRGQYPGAGLAADGRGYFWGTTSRGGANDVGTLFRISTTTGAFESMFDLSADTPSGSAPGSYPYATLFLHTDGNLYGTTTGLSLDPQGMRKAGGNVFRVRFGRKLSVTSNWNSTITRSSSILDGETSNFGGVYDVEASAKRTFTILNPGTTPITNVTAVVSGDHASDFKVTVPPPSSFTLGARTARPIEVTFDPSAAGDCNALLTLGGTSPDTDVFLISLRGTGILRQASIVQPSYLQESGVAQPVQVTLSAPLSVPVKIPFKVQPGTATAADFSVSASPVVIPAGSTTGIIWVTPKKDYIVEGQNENGLESFGIILGQPLNPHVALATGREATTVFIQDDDAVPSFDVVGGGGTYAPGSACAVVSGFNNPSGLPFTGTWTHDGRIIRGATQPVFWIPSITRAHAGVYQYTVRTVTGLTLSSLPMRVWVIDQAYVRSLAVREGGSISLPSLAAGGGLSFSWIRTTATATDEPLSDGGRFSGTGTATLRITGATLDDAGQYFCQISGGDIEGVAFTLAVETSAPQPTSPEFPPAAVGKLYNYSLPRSGGSVTEPSAIVATGLPPGLVCDRGSGVITGRATVPGRFKVRVTMSNSHGSNSTSAYLEVSKLPEAFVGTYVGIVSGGEYSNIGARIDLTTTLNSVVSGALTIGKTRRAFVGRLQLDDESGATCNISLPGSNSAAVAGIRLELTFDQMNHLGGRLSSGYDNPEVEGWRNVWNARSHPASTVDGYYTLALPDTLMSGSGYGALVVGLNGSATISGRLPDDSVFVTNAPLHPDCWLMIYQSLYPELGGLIAFAHIDPSGEPGGLNKIDQPSGAGWCTPPKKAKTRFFQNGVSSTINHFLSVVGSSYSRPPAGTCLLGLPVSGGSNAQFTFHIDPTSDLTSFVPPNVVFRIGPDHKAVLPAPGTAANPGRVAQVSFNATTGYFTGAFALDYRTPLARASTFKGILVPGMDRGYGFFILPAPADLNAVPPTTLLTSPMVSGQIEMSAYPTPAPVN